uniref:CCHC-type domain-containing protein n=1 Tax=Steinernema glaseri TaxID=37863 RepID=A0A1I7ZSB9_9BILA
MDSKRKQIQDCVAHVQARIDEVQIIVSQPKPGEVEKLAEYYSSQLSQVNEGTIKGFKSYHQLIKKKFDEYSKMFKKLNDQDQAHYEKEMNTTQESVDSIIMALEMLQIDLQVHVDNIANGRADYLMRMPSTTASTQSAGMSAMKMIEDDKIPTFDGDMMEWPNWKRLYDEMIHKAQTPDFVKFNKLVRLVKGKAKATIARFVVDEKYYADAYSALEHRFGNKTKLTLELYHRLQEIKFPTQRIDEQQQFVDDVSAIYAQMKELDPHTDNIHTTQTILSKLPVRLRERLIEKLAKQDLGDVKVLLEKLDGLLELEDYHQYVSNSRWNSIMERTQDENPCTYCKRGNHRSEDCRIVTDRRSREKIIRQEDRCFNCLQPGHRTADCGEQSCNRCGRKHHISLCSPQESINAQERSSQGRHEDDQTANRYQDTQTRFSAGNTETDSGNPTCSSRFIMCNTRLQVKTKEASNRVLTATAKVYNEKKKAYEEIAVILDTGAEVSVISDSAAKRLGLSTVERKHVELKTLGDSPVRQKVYETTRLDLYDKDKNRIQMTALKLKNKLMSKQQKMKLDATDSDFLAKENIKLDSSIDSVCDPELLIGTDYLARIFIDGMVRSLPSGLKILPTCFGNVVMGGAQQKSNEADENEEETLGGLAQSPSKGSESSRTPREGAGPAAGFPRHKGEHDIRLLKSFSTTPQKKNRLGKAIDSDSAASVRPLQRAGVNRPMGGISSNVTDSTIASPIGLKNGSRHEGTVVSESNRQREREVSGHRGRKRSLERASTDDRGGKKRCALPVDSCKKGEALCSRLKTRPD